MDAPVPAVALVRRWAVEWLAARDPTVCEQILAPSYGIRIGGFLLAERDTYVAGTLEQLDRFPGLGVTVHELITDGERVAVRLTEHGAAPAQDGRAAGWGAVALFRSGADRLTDCWAEEDYLSRRRQLESGVPDPIEAPAASPWTASAVAGDPIAEEIVRHWLEQGDLVGVELDDGWLGHDAVLALRDPGIELDEIFSAGGAVAFHGALHGAYADGLDLPGAARGRPVTVHLAGLVHVEDGTVSSGRVIRDRLGARRALQRELAA